MQKNARVYSYLRFSDARQSAGSSADRQLQYAAQWAAEHDLILDDRLSMRDEGLSAYHQRHVKQGALGVFLQAIEAGQIAAGSVLIVEGLDRLSRAEPIQAQAQLAQIINAGITVVTASDGKQYNRARLKNNPMDLVYSLLVMIRAHEESDTKAKRVRAALLRQVKGWLAGSYRGRITCGKDPQWLRWNGEEWEEIAERTTALRLALQLYQQGLGGKPVLERLKESGLQLTDGGLPHQTNFYRMLQNPALYGTRIIDIEGESYTLDGYYPAIISRAAFDDIQRMVRDRTRRGPPSIIQPVITGMGILRCGYCGSSMCGQHTHGKKPRADGMPHDGHRRLQCTAKMRSNTDCATSGSCSVVPVENAIIDYCSDQLNLTSLTSSADIAGPIRQRLAEKRSEADALAAQLARMADALAEAGSDAPRTFLQKARQLEDALDNVNKDIAALEQDLMHASQHTPTAASEWAAVAEGVKTLDADARLKARQLVIETFSRIVIYSQSLQPPDSGKAAPGTPIDIVLIPVAGQPRSLRLNRKTGSWVSGDDWQL